MKWLEGKLRQAPHSDRLELRTPERRITFLCGTPLEIRVDGRWRRGRVEWSDRLGWHWTDSTLQQKLCAGDQVRFWDGLPWPPLRRDGLDLARSEGMTRG